MTIRSMKTAGMALNVGLCNNIEKCKVKKSQLRGLGLWRRPTLKSQKYGKPRTEVPIEIKSKQIYWSFLCIHKMQKGFL